ncbi:MAG: hypothetical protein AAF125_25485 [Chloroflexota bacterium]
MTRPQKLVSSPLMALPLIDAHPAYDLSAEGPLERARVLRLLLGESIARLRPATDDPSGVTDEWRHYNALFIPYVAGVKPYSTRVPLDDLDPDTRLVVEWMRAHVPERTLYNWQSAAAKLVAADLRAQIEHENGKSG